MVLVPRIYVKAELLEFVFIHQLDLKVINENRQPIRRIFIVKYFSFVYFRIYSFSFDFHCLYLI